MSLFLKLKLVLATSLVLTIGCGEVINVQNRAPSLKRIEFCREAGSIFLLLDINDPEGDPTDVAVILNDFDADSGLEGTGKPSVLAPGQTGIGLVGLNTQATPRWHQIEWAQCGDPGRPCALTAQITELAQTDACVCLRDELAVQTVPPLTLVMKDRQGSESIFEFPEGVPIRAQCPTDAPF